MASFDFCVDEAFKSGKITKAVAETIKAADDAEAAINSLVSDLTRQKREAAIQSIRMADAWENIQSHEGSAYDGLISLMAKDQTGRAAYNNVEMLGRYYEGQFDSQFGEALSRFRTRSLGFEQDQEGLRLLTKAIYGETVEDAEIMQFAKDWHNVIENARLEFNAKGGSVSKNEKYLLPQNHDAAVIEKLGLDEWKARITPMLDRQNMLDDAGKPLDDKALSEGLDYTFESITSHGLNKTKDFSVPMLGKKLSRKGADKRFLYFKDADSWLTYQKDFGKGDIFTTMTDHLGMKAHDIGLMEVFGTSPDSTFAALRGMVEKKQKLKANEKFLLDALYNVVAGKTNQGELTGVADFMQSTRNILSAGILGKAFISALSDVSFSGITTFYNNVPTFKTLSRQLSLLNPAHEADRVFAVKLGLIADSWKSRAHAANRYADVYGQGVTAKASEAVMRGSLLSPWTDAGRKAFGMEYSSMLADNFGKSLDDLHSSTQRAFKSYGINEADWNTFRKSKPLDFKGAKFADMTQDGGKKFHQMVMSETDFAVPTPDAKVQAMTTGGTGRATIEGQAWRSVMMLKSFPITLATTHFYRAAYQATTADKIAYAAALTAATTVMGGVALQAKDLAAGREARNVDADFFKAAWLQGGGLGIFGDFIFSDVNRFGGGITQTLIGPMGQMLDKSVKFTLGNVREAVKGEETNILGESVDLLKSYAPDVWQTSLFTNALYDQMSLMADPKAQRRFNRIVRKRQTEFNQGYWWKPGEPSPEFAQ